MAQETACHSPVELVAGKERTGFDLGTEVVNACSAEEPLTWQMKTPAIRVFSCYTIRCTSLSFSFSEGHKKIIFIVSDTAETVTIRSATQLGRVSLANA